LLLAVDVQKMLPTARMTMFSVNRLIAIFAEESL
jgi:hypothetical protein